MKKPVVFLMAVSLSLQVWSQQKELNEFHNLQLQNVSNNLNLITEVEGNPYSNQELIPGTIVFVSGNKIEDIPMRYNWYTKLMEIKYKDQLKSVPPSHDISYVQIRDQRYVPFYYLEDIKGYLVQLYEGTISLFRGEDIHFIEAKPAQSGYESAKPPKFESYGPIYYAILSDGRFFELKTNNNKLPLQFPENQIEITSLIKEKRLNVKKEPDLIELFQRLDTANKR